MSEVAKGSFPALEEVRFELDYRAASNVGNPE